MTRRACDIAQTNGSVNCWCKGAQNILRDDPQTRGIRAHSGLNFMIQPFNSPFHHFLCLHLTHTSTHSASLLPPVSPSLTFQPPSLSLCTSMAGVPPLGSFARTFDGVQEHIVDSRTGTSSPMSSHTAGAASSSREWLSGRHSEEGALSPLSRSAGMAGVALPLHQDSLARAAASPGPQRTLLQDELSPFEKTMALMKHGAAELQKRERQKAALSSIASGAAAGSSTAAAAGDLMELDSSAAPPSKEGQQQHLHTLVCRVCDQPLLQQSSSLGQRSAFMAACCRCKRPACATHSTTCDSCSQPFCTFCCDTDYSGAFERKLCEACQGVSGASSQLVLTAWHGQASAAGEGGAGQSAAGAAGRSSPHLTGKRAGQEDIAMASAGAAGAQAGKGTLMQFFLKSKP